MAQGGGQTGGQARTLSAWYSYYEGKGVKTDYERTMGWFESVLDKDRQKRFPDIFGPASVPGENYTKNMGKMMKKDPHVQRNANFMLGMMHEKGQGTVANRGCAVKYYTEAAKAGHKRAKQRLNEMEKEERALLKAQERQKKLAGKMSGQQETVGGSESVQDAETIPVQKTEVVHNRSEPLIMAEQQKAKETVSFLGVASPDQVLPTQQILIVQEIKEATVSRKSMEQKTGRAEKSPICEKIRLFRP